MFSGDRLRDKFDVFHRGKSLLNDITSLFYRVWFWLPEDIHTYKQTDTLCRGLIILHTYYFVLSL